MAFPTRNQTQIDGGLYELSARGTKDSYFIKDDKESVHPFQWTYGRYPASLPEERWTNPLNEPKFGQRCEFEFDLPGDVLMEAWLQIRLPTWLPPELAPYNPVSETYSQDGSGNSVYWGYVNGIAYFLFEKIQIFQDKILLQEVSGDSLYATQLNKGSWNQAFLKEKLAGVHDGSALGIMRNATPGELRLDLPMIGCSAPGDKGLPLCGLRNQTFRLRLHLRPIEQLVECTDPNNYSPQPWTQMFYQDRDGGAYDAEGMAIPLVQIGKPSIVLRTRQLYLLNEARTELAKEAIEVPYIRYFDNGFSINQLDYAPLDRGGTANIIKFIDANYTVERIVTYFRSATTMFRNRLWDFSNSATLDATAVPVPVLVSTSVNGQFYSDMKLTIAGQTREGPWNEMVWQTLMTEAKEERSLAQNIATMDWSRGWRIDDEPPAVREPTGGINFTTADRPMITVNLFDVERDPTLGYKQTQMVSCCESWALYRIRGGRGGLEYAN
jgi:hypothetical protein